MIKELISGLITCSSHSETHGIAQSYLRYRDTMTAIAMFISPRLLDLVMKQISLRHQPHLVRLRFNQRPLLKAGAGGNWIAMSPPHFAVMSYSRPFHYRSSKEWPCYFVRGEIFWLCPGVCFRSIIDLLDLTCRRIQRSRTEGPWMSLVGDRLLKQDVF
jgi:hypothetical protein